MSQPFVVELADVVKSYGGLRPLRIQRLSVAAGESIAIIGLDGVMAEVFVNLVTGAVLPDQGEIRVFGRATTAVTDGTEWLAIVDKFGIVSERAVLLDALDVMQNLALPHTVEIDPIPPETQERARSLAQQVGLAPSSWPTAVGELDLLARARVRLGRAIAHDPAVLLLEHASANMAGDAARAFGEQVRHLATKRAAAVIALTADPLFASAVATRVFSLNAGSGELEEPRRRGWFGGGRVG